jgi:hypothetical protein
VPGSWCGCGIGRGGPGCRRGGQRRRILHTQKLLCSEYAVLSLLGLSTGSILSLKLFVLDTLLDEVDEGSGREVLAAGGHIAEQAFLAKEERRMGVACT